MTIHPTPNIKYPKGILVLAERYGKKQVSENAARALNKAFDLEVSQLQMQLDDIQRVMADYEKQYGMKSAEFFAKFDSGKTDDRMDYVEWAGLFQMAEDLREQIHTLTSEGQA